jgi:hypothetical protein
MSQKSITFEVSGCSADSPRHLQMSKHQALRTTIRLQYTYQGIKIILKINIFFNLIVECFVNFYIFNLVTFWNLYEG